MEKNENERKLHALRTDILYFIRVAWGKTPQPIKPEYAGTPPDLFEAKMFGDAEITDDGIERWTWYDFDREKHLTWQQVQILDAVNRNKQVTVSSGRGIGKTTVEAFIIHWALFRNKNTKGACTAPSKEQMFDILWAELAVWHRRLADTNPAIHALYEWQSTYFRVNESPETWFASAKTGKKENVEALAGCHCPVPLLLADEACFDEDTEILTQEGFKYFKDLSESDWVLSQDMNTEVAEFVPIEKMHRYDGEREMYYYKQRGADFAVTANHKMVYTNRNTKRQRLEEIQKLDKSGNVTFPRKVSLSENSINFQFDFYVPEYRSERIYYPSRKVPMHLWCSLVAWHLSDGSVDKNNYTNLACHSEKNPENYRIGKKILDEIGVRYSENKRGFIISDRSFGNELKKYGMGFKDKFIPQYIKHSRFAWVFLETFATIGDGYVRDNRKIFYTSSPRMRDDLQEMLYLSGSAGTITERQFEKKKWYKDHYIETKNQSYAIIEREPTDIKYKKENLEIKNHKGAVYCVTTKHGTVFTRRNGHCFWSGNSGVAEEIFKVALDGLTEDDYLFFMASNPRRMTGFFRDSHRDGSSWHKLKYNSMQSPLYNVDKARQIFDEEVLKGEDGYRSARFRYEVLGEFPLEEGMDEKGYLPLVNVIRFAERKEPFIGERAMGIDPSGMGKDKSEFVIRDNFKARLVATEKTSTSKTIARIALTLMKEYDIPAGNVVIDNFGEGANVAKELALAGYDTSPINVGDTNVAQDYMNLRAFLFWRIRQAMNQGFELGYDKIWEDEKPAIKYTRTLNDKIKMMSKDEIRRERLRSPNAWDALALSFYVDLKHQQQERETREYIAKRQKFKNPVANLFRKKL